MSAKQADAESSAPHPRETTALFGHREAEAALLNAYKSGRIPHAWLIGGARGIGKATLAYRMARFVLTHRDPLSPAVQHAETLAVDESAPAARHIANGAHGGLLVLERTANDKGVLRTVITVDETRETISFFGSTAAVEGWRVCIVDTVDELNPNAANALLKILEEPPQQSLFLLVSHAPARRYAYYLTPKGFAEKSRLTVQYLSDSFSFFRQARADCSQALALAKERHFQRLVLSGQSDLAEIAILSAVDCAVTVVAIVDDASTSAQFVGSPVVAGYDDVAEPFDAVMITNVVNAREAFDRAVARFGAERVLAPALLGLSAPARRGGSA